MEGSDSTTERQSNLPDEAEELDISMNEQDPKPESEASEPSVPVESDESVVSSTTKDDQTDGPKQESEDKNLEEHQSSPSAVIDLIYWQDLKKTAVVFGTILLLLLFLAYHTVLSVASFFSLSVLTVSLLYRVGVTVIGAVQKTGTGSPYKSLLEKNISISTEKARDIGECIGNKANCVIAKLVKLFLVEDFLASVKFGMFLWFMSCVGRCFDAVTLMIIGTVLLFSAPKLYEDHQTQVDQLLCKVCKKTDEMVKTVKAKIESRLKKEKSS